MSLATITDYAELFQVQSPDAALQARIQQCLDISTATIQNGRRLFTPGTADVVYIDGTNRPSFTLPYNKLPVNNVSLVTEIRYLNTSPGTVDPTMYDWDEFGVVTLNGRGYPTWTHRRRGIQATFDHGYAVIPVEVAGICLAYAKRLFDDPAAAPILMERLGDYQVQYEAGGGLTTPERELLTQYEVPQWP